jgi:hypothetical protein
MNTVQQIARFRCFFLLAALAALVVTVAPDARSNSNTNPMAVSDPKGDSGTAPDITKVTVSNDDNGQIRFRITLLKGVEGADVTVAVAIDSDQDATTGLSGTDYLLVADLSDNTYGLVRWNGTEFVDTPSSSVSASRDGDGITLSVNRGELGNSGGLNFWARSLEGSEPVDGRFDDAPDSGTWSYQLMSPEPLKLGLAAFFAPKRVAAGKTLTAAMAATRSDTGELVGDEGQVRCRASIGGKSLRLLTSGFVKIGSASGANCSWRVPKTAHRKTIRASITIAYQGATVSRQFSTKVK